MNTIIVTGGGSGGHIAPIRAIGPSLKKERKVVWMGTSDFEKHGSQLIDVEFKKIMSGKMRRGLNFSNLWRNFVDLFRVEIGFWQSLFFMRKVKPEIVFSTGGFVSVPVVLAAWFLRIPVVIHEQTIGFGLSNKIAAMFAKKILIAFEDSRSYISKKHHSKIELVGNPVREKLLGGNKKNLEEHLEIELKEDKPILYITGGGRGSKRMNDVVEKNLESLCAKFYVIHQTGMFGIARAKKNDIKDYFPYQFIGKELADIYACADLVLSRAGAGTVNELDHFGIYGIFVPLRPVQNDEQTKNAEWFLRSNKGAIIPQDDFSSSTFLLELEKFRYDGLLRDKKNEYKNSPSSDLILKNLA